MSSLLRSAAALSVALATLVVLVCAPAPRARGSGLGFGWPLAPPVQVTRGFDPPAQRWQAGHRGIDLAAAAGATVRAAGAGVVSFAGRVGGRPVVSIRHDDDLLTTYEPVIATVRLGDRVSRGDPIGTLAAGHPGCAGAACLHWGARRGRGHDSVYFDPRALIGGLRVRLKPL